MKDDVAKILGNFMREGCTYNDVEDDIQQGNVQQDDLQQGDVHKDDVQQDEVQENEDRNCLALCVLAWKDLVVYSCS